jgi:hypothetical protein
MSTQEAKTIYDSLKSSGDLKKIYNSMSGDWGKDKNMFLKQYKTNEELIRSVEDDFGDNPDI